MNVGYNEIPTTFIMESSIKKKKSNSVILLFCHGRILHEIFSDQICKNVGDNRSFRAYSNPAEDILYVDINSDKSERATISVTNVAGKLVLKDEISVSRGINKVPVKLTNLSKGAYIIKVQSGSEILPRNLISNRYKF